MVKRLDGHTGGFLLAVMLLIMTVSCQKDPWGGMTHSRARVSVEFSIGVKAEEIPEGIGTRNSEEGSLSISYTANPNTRGVEDETVSNLWILQFGEDGSPLINPVYLTSQNLTKNTNVGYTTYGFRVDMAQTENSIVYFVANTGNSTLFGSGLTLDQFRDRRIEFTDYSDIASRGEIMVGTYSGPIPSSPQPFAWIKRIVSKIGLAVNYADPLSSAGGTLTLTSTEVRSIPLTGSYAPLQSPFPASGPSENSVYTSSGIAYGDPRDGTPVYYVTENLRGGNASVLHEKLKWRENDPSWEGGTSYATHVVMKGTYDDGIPKGTGLVTITLYPGENNRDDYNLVRNSSYVMNVDISELHYEYGPDRDYRIEVDYDPFITYRYHYEKPSYNNEADKYQYIGQDYLTSSDVTPGASVTASASILNAMKYLVPAGDYMDGRADPDPLVVAADNRLNVVDVYYDIQVEKSYTVQINYLRETTNAVLRQPRFVTYPEGTQLSISMLKEAGLAPDGIVGDDGNDYQRVVPTGETSVRLTVDQEGLSWNLVYKPLSITPSQRYIKFHYVYGDKDGPEILPADLVLATVTTYYYYNAPNYIIPGYAFVSSEPESIRRLEIVAGTIADMYLVYTDGELVTFNYVENGSGMVIKDPISVWLPLNETFTLDDIKSATFYALYRSTVYHEVVTFNQNAYGLMPEITEGLPFTVTMNDDHNVTFYYQCISYIECTMGYLMQNNLWVESFGAYYLGPGAEFDYIKVIYTFSDGTTEEDKTSSFNKAPGVSMNSFIFAPVKIVGGDQVRTDWYLYLKNTPQPVSNYSIVVVSTPS